LSSELPADELEELKVRIFKYLQKNYPDIEEQKLACISTLEGPATLPKSWQQAFKEVLKNLRTRIPICYACNREVFDDRVHFRLLEKNGKSRFFNFHKKCFQGMLKPGSDILT